MGTAQITAAQPTVALVLANYPNKDGRLANGVGLDTPAATVHALSLLRADGYDPSILIVRDLLIDMKIAIEAGRALLYETSIVVDYQIGINKALEKHNGKRKYAAQDLGISERTLYRKIKEYNIEQ